MATRFCLSHAWPGPHCLLLSPQEQKGNVEAWEAPALPGKPCWPSRSSGRSPGRPSSVPSGPPSCRGAATEGNGPGSIPSTHSRASPREAVGDSRESCPGHWAQPLLLQDCSSLQGSPGTASPAAPGAPAALPCSAGSSQLLQCPNPEMCLCHTSGTASTARGLKTLQHHSQASFSGVERMGRTRGSCYKYKICYKEKTYIVHL